MFGAVVRRARSQYRAAQLYNTCRGSSGAAAPAAAAAAAAAKAAVGPVATAEGDDSEDGDGVGAAAESDGDGEEGESDTEKAKGVPNSEEANAAQDINSSADVGRCALLVTQQGYAIRMPLELKRIGLRRRGGAGCAAMKVSGNNQVIAACIVSGKPEIKAPAPPRSPCDIWCSRQEPVTYSCSTPAAGSTEARPLESPNCAPDAALTAAATTAASGEAQASELSAMDVEKAGAPKAQQLLGPTDLFAEQQKRFDALSEEEKQVYVALAEEDQQRYAVEFEAYQREDVEEVLLGSEKGLILRVAVGAIPTAVRANRGRRLCKLKPGDRLCVTSLLSSMDDDPDEGGGGATSTAPAPQARLGGAPGVRRRGAPGRPKGAISRLASRAALAGADGSSSVGPLAASMDIEARGSMRSPKGKWRLLGKTRTSLTASPAGGLGGKRRLLGKTRVSLCPWLGKRGRLSLLASSAAASQVSRSPVGRLSLLKPELRLLRSERRNTVRRVCDLSALRSESASSASAATVPLLPTMGGTQ